MVFVRPKLVAVKSTKIILILRHKNINYTLVQVPCEISKMNEFKLKDYLPNVQQNKIIILKP